jgi:Tfp pilus assembly protein PilX
MLTKPFRQPVKEQGVVLLIALIVLIAMTLAGIALVRSVDTTNLIAANMAFQQSATHSSDTGVESAVGYISSIMTTDRTTLWVDDLAKGYFASRQDPVPGQSVDAYWTNLVTTTGVTPQAIAGQPVTGDAASNKVLYVIERMCNGPGDAGAIVGVPPTCNISPITGVARDEGTDMGPDTPHFRLPASGLSYYYRITVRVAGPRSSVSFVQAIVSA